MTSNTAQLDLVRRALTSVGATLPAGVTKAIAEHDKVVALASIPAATAEQIADAVTECLLNDRDPLDDEQVRRFATSHVLAGTGGRGMSYPVQLSAERRVVAAVAANVHPILALLGKAATKAGQTLTEAHHIIGDLDLNDSKAILAMGSDAARAWSEAREAQDNLRRISDAWVALATLTRFAPTSTDQVSRLADLTLEQFDKVGRTADAWAIVKAGGTISLADADTTRERLGKLNAARESRTARAADALSTEYRRTHGTGVSV